MGAILDEARGRGITRLCHFTRSASFVGILSAGELQDTDGLRQSADGYRPTDVNRYDGHLGHVCLSLEYPNAWYFRRAEGREPVFHDWLVLTLDLGLLDAPGTKFCPHNAARDFGAGIRGGVGGFRGLFAHRVRDDVRLPGHPDWWPTDDQAEVLVPGPIPLSSVRSVLVRSHDQAELEQYRLGLLGAATGTPPFVVAPDLFDPRLLSAMVRRGARPTELALSA